MSTMSQGLGILKVLPWNMIVEVQAFHWPLRPSAKGFHAEVTGFQKTKPVATLTSRHPNLLP